MRVDVACGSQFSFRYVDPGGHTQVVGLGNKCLNLLSHASGRIYYIIISYCIIFFLFLFTYLCIHFETCSPLRGPVNLKFTFLLK